MKRRGKHEPSYHEVTNPGNTRRKYLGPVYTTLKGLKMQFYFYGRENEALRNVLKIGGIWKHRLCVLVCAENILKTKHVISLPVSFLKHTSNWWSVIISHIWFVLRNLRLIFQHVMAPVCLSFLYFPLSLPHLCHMAFPLAITLL